MNIFSFKKFLRVYQDFDLLKVYLNSDRKISNQCYYSFKNTSIEEKNETNENIMTGVITYNLREGKDRLCHITLVKLNDLVLLESFIFIAVHFKHTACYMAYCTFMLLLYQQKIWVIISRKELDFVLLRKGGDT